MNLLSGIAIFEFKFYYSKIFDQIRVKWNRMFYCEYVAKRFFEVYLFQLLIIGRGIISRSIRYLIN